MAHRHKAHKNVGGGTWYTAASSNVAKEAKEKKRGGRAKELGRATGGRASVRLDKRARGGRVGSDRSPFSSAARGSDTGRTSKTNPTHGP